MVLRSRLGGWSRRGVCKTRTPPLQRVGRRLRTSVRTIRSHAQLGCVSATCPILPITSDPVIKDESGHEMATGRRQARRDGTVEAVGAVQCLPAPGFCKSLLASKRIQIELTDDGSVPRGVRLAGEGASSVIISASVSAGLLQRKPTLRSISFSFFLSLPPSSSRGLRSAHTHSICACADERCAAR
ncbi:hypothetical protein GGR51DRAFT_59554 [Nemania sp. FL0031]|nr:hypothetical protein GGR51DRAFT_59554 [Nemania sp. FL0031]